MVNTATYHNVDSHLCCPVLSGHSAIKRGAVVRRDGETVQTLSPSSAQVKGHPREQHPVFGIDAKQRCVSTGDDIDNVRIVCRVRIFGLCSASWEILSD